MMVVDTYNIERSTKPVWVVTVFTDNDIMTYFSSAFNECENTEKIETYFEISKHVIFGDAGPKVKSNYTIPKSERLQTVAFCDEMHASYCVSGKLEGVEYYFVPDTCKVRLRE